jgi:thymidylate synthase
MKQYVELLSNIIEHGEERHDRTGVGTKAIFGGQLTFDLRERFPLVTVKETRWRKAFIEMLWFLRGEPNTSFLKAHDVGIWDEWAKDGQLGPVYGVQWRGWKQHKVVNAEEVIEHDNHSKTYLDTKLSVTEIDQVKELINKLKHKPHDRRLIVSAWNVAELGTMALPPCHRDFQCYVTNDGYLDLMWAQRSVDTMLGLPFNIAQYALLSHMLAQCAGLKPRFLKVNYGDAHIYLNHIEAAQQVIKLQPIECPTKLVMNPYKTDIDSFVIDDFDITGYESHPFIKLPVAV